MYQAQQEAELGELQNQENVKQLFQSVRLQPFTLKTRHWKQREDLSKELFGILSGKLIHKYRMRR